MIKLLTVASAALALTVVAQPAAAAVNFSGNYAVTQFNSNGPGLNVSVSPNPGALNFSMNDAPSILNNKQLF